MTKSRHLYLKQTHSSKSTEARAISYSITKGHIMSLSLEEELDKEHLLSIFNFLLYKAEEEKGMMCYISPEEATSIIESYRKFYNRIDSKIAELDYQYEDNKSDINKIKESQRKQVIVIRDLNAKIQKLQSELEMLKAGIK